MLEEEKRHRCEVRDWIRRRRQMGPDAGREWLRQVIEDIGKKRGKQAAERLKRDIAEQWKWGNRGAQGDWRSEAAAA